jgi:serine/threonine protein kinase/tetratricopeptide (TPR) repeat protein
VDTGDDQKGQAGLAAPPRLDVLDEVGRGGVAVVERVRLAEPIGHLRSGSLAARKRAGRDDPASRASLAREASVAAALSHPSVVRLVATWTGAAGPELLFELVPGQTLERWLAAEEGPLPEPMARRAGADLAEALAHLHTSGFVHGDVSLANARLDADGRAVLLDLGQARASGDTSDGGQGGTLAYFAPERVIGGPPSAAADVFALGVVLYQLASGRHPFAPSAFAPGTTPPDLDTYEGERVLGALAAARYVPPSRHAPAVSPLLDALLGEVLDRRPNNRPSPQLVGEVLRVGEDHPWWRERIRSSEHEKRLVTTKDPFVLPLVGRDEALRTLDAAYRYCVDTTTGGSVVLARGVKGSGRSRLVHHFVDLVRREVPAPLFLYARASEEVESRPHGAALRLLERWLMLDADSSPSSWEIEMLRRTVPPREADVLIAALDSRSRGPLGGSISRAIVRWVAALVKERTAILFVDDLHAARSNTLATVERLVDALPDMRAMVVLGYGEDTAPARPRAFERLVRKVERLPEGRAVVTLGDLAPADVVTIVRERFENAVDAERLGAALWEKSRGNPGVLTELFHAMHERGQLGENEAGRWQLLVQEGALPEPQSLEAGVAARLEGLEADGRRWLERLTVLPSRIDPAYAQSVFPGSRRSEFDRALALLVRRGFIEASGPHYRFKRPALRDAVYAALPQDRRQRLHRLVAQSLDVDDPTLEQSFARARHLRAAGEHKALVALIADLLPQAGRRVVPTRVLRLAHWAIEAIDALPPSPERSEQLLRFLEHGADSAGRIGARADERALLERLANVQPDSATRPDAAARLYYLNGRALSETGQLGVARGILRAAVTASEKAGSHELLGRSLRLMSMVQLRSGNIEHARASALRALLVARTDDERCACAVLLGNADLLEDRIEDAIERASDAQKWLKNQPEPLLWLVPHVQVLRARVLRMAGRPQRALAALHLALEDARQASERPLEAEILARIANLEMEARDFTAAEVHVREALEIAEETESPFPRALASVWHGMLAWERNDPTARATLADAVATARDLGHYRAEAVARALLARLHSLSNEHDESRRESERAVSILVRHGAELFDRILIEGSRALVLRRAGEPALAEPLEAALRTRIESPTPPIVNAEVADARRTYARQLLAGVLDAEGPIFPAFQR